MAETDSTLLQAVAAGDETALATLIGRYHRQVRAACVRQCPPADIDDCIQAVFLVLHRRPSAAAKAPALLAWLLKVSHYVCLRAGSAERRRRRIEGAVEVQAEVRAGPDPAVLDHLDAALLQLNERQRAAVLWHVVDGEAAAAIAERLDVSPDNARKLIQRGLEGLRSLLQRRGVPVGAAALAACLAQSGGAAETVPANLVTLITRAPSVRAKLFATKAISAMTITSLVPAASILLIGGLIGAGVLAAEPAPRPGPTAEVPPVVAPAPAVPADRRLAQPVTAMLTGRGILPAIRQLNSLLRERLDVVLPQHQFSVELNVALDGPVKAADIAVVLPPGSTVATALDGIAEQTGCTWRMAEGLVCFEDRVQLLDPLGTTWDALDVHRALTQGDAATVGRGIAAWLDLPQRRPIRPLLIHPRTWLGRVALLGDPQLAERFRQACPDLPGARNYFDDAMLGDPHPTERLGGPVDPADLTRLVWTAEADPQEEEAGIAAVDALLSVPDVGHLAVYAARLADVCSVKSTPESPFRGAPRIFRMGAERPAGKMDFFGDGPENLHEALTRLLVIRGDGDLRRQLLDSGVLQRFGAGMAGSGSHPAWNHRLAEALATAEEDTTRVLAERILASSADPENWTRLLACWRTSHGIAQKRLTGLVMGAGRRGCDAVLAALADGSLPVDVLTACLEANESDVPVPLIGLCATVAGSPIWPERLRQAAALRICAAPAHPLAARVASALIREGSKGSRTLLVGLGLRLKFSQGLVADGDPDVAQALRSTSPYLRAVALTIEDQRIAQARERSVLLMRRELLRRFPGAEPPASTWPKSYGHGPFVHYLAPDPKRAADMLAVARNDPDPGVRLRAAAVGLHLLAETEARDMLRSLAAQEKLPALRKRLDDRSPNRTVNEDNTVTTTWNDPEILTYGPGFPEWRESKDGNDLVPLNDADQERSLPGSIHVIEQDAATPPVERPTRSY